MTGQLIAQLSQLWATDEAIAHLHASPDLTHDLLCGLHRVLCTCEEDCDRVGNDSELDDLWRVKPSKNEGSFVNIEWIALLERHKVLDKLLIPLLSKKISKHHGICTIIAVLNNLHQELSIDSLFAGETTPPVSILLRNLCTITDGGHFAHMALACQFFGKISLKYDVPSVKSAVKFLVDESLLKPLIVCLPPESKSQPGGIFGDPVIAQLSDAYHVTDRVLMLLRENTAEAFVCGAWVWLLDAWNRCLISQEALIQSSVDVLRMLVDITSQSVTGRYSSWFLYSYGPPTIRIDRSTPFFGFDWLRQNAITHQQGRLLHGLLMQLESNITRFLVMPSTKNLVSGIEPWRMHVNDEKFNRNMGFDSAYPDESYLSDLKYGNIFLPTLGTRFLDWNDYVSRNLALFKASVSLSLAEDSEAAWHQEEAKGNVYLARDFRVNSQPLRYSRHHVAELYLSTRDDAVLLAEWMDVVEMETLQHQLGNLNVTNVPNDLLFHADDALLGDAQLSSAIVLLTGKIGNEPFLRGGRFWKRSKTAILLLVDPSFAEWFSETQPKVEYVYIANPQMSAYTHVLAKIEKMLGEANMSTWLHRLILGHISPNDAVKLATELPEGGVPDRVRMQGMAKGYADVVEAAADMCAAARCSKSPVTFNVVIDENKDESCLLKYGTDTHISYGKSTWHPYQSQRMAIFSSLFHRVTLIVGPPGTGKTDVTCALTRILHSIPNQKIAIAAQSNLALDQMIEKLMPVLPLSFDGTPALVRLGMRYVLPCASQCTPAAHRLAIAQHRDDLMMKYSNSGVGRLISALYTAISESKNVMRAVNELESHIQGPFEELYRAALSKLRSTTSKLSADISEFLASFGINEASGRREAYMSLRAVKQQLVSLIASTKLGILSSYEFDRAIIERTPIICLTCSGAAMRDRDLSNVRFDSLIVEEAGKILETEMIPLLSHNPKRIILIGDDKQLAPLVRDKQVRQRGNYDQSLFKRLQLLGIKPITLDMQGRAAPAICDLYRWRYPSLHDLKMDVTFTDAVRARVQFISVKGSDADPEVNSEECAMVVSIVTHLTNKGGIHSDRITVLSPYRRQVALLNQALSVRVCTTDEYQGLQNDVIVVSLVNHGNTITLHNRDERRITVMLSRARLGLYLVGHRQIFEDCDEWRPVFDALRRLGPDFYHSQFLCTDTVVSTPSIPKRVTVPRFSPAVARVIEDAEMERSRVYAAGGPDELIAAVEAVTLDDATSAFLAEGDADTALTGAISHQRFDDARSVKPRSHVIGRSGNTSKSSAVPNPSRARPRATVRASEPLTEELNSATSAFLAEGEEERSIMQSTQVTAISTPSVTLPSSSSTADTKASSTTDHVKASSTTDRVKASSTTDRVKASSTADTKASSTTGPIVLNTADHEGQSQIVVNTADHEEQSQEHMSWADMVDEEEEEMRKRGEKEEEERRKRGEKVEEERRKRGEKEEERRRKRGEKEEEERRKRGEEEERRKKVEKEERERRGERRGGRRRGERRGEMGQVVEPISAAAKAWLAEGEEAEKLYQDRHETAWKSSRRRK